jgi:hypothetical protein
MCMVREVREGTSGHRGTGGLMAIAPAVSVGRAWEELSHLQVTTVRHRVRRPPIARLLVPPLVERVFGEDTKQVRMPRVVGGSPPVNHAAEVLHQFVRHVVRVLAGAQNVHIHSGPKPLKQERRAVDLVEECDWDGGDTPLVRQSRDIRLRAAEAEREGVVAPAHSTVDW